MDKLAFIGYLYVATPEYDSYGRVRTRPKTLCRRAAVLLGLLCCRKPGYHP